MWLIKEKLYECIYQGKFGFLKEKTEDSSIKPSNEYRIKTVKVMYYWLLEK